MEIVDKRNTDTLQPIIQRVCRPGTLIYSDEWAAYRSIHDNLGFDHETVCHKDNFVNPLTGVHTQNVESYWNKHKTMLQKVLKGTRRNCLSLHLAEAMFRERHEGYVLDGLMGVIADIHRHMDS